MSKVRLSKTIKLVLKDGDSVYPSTMKGSFHKVEKGSGHNILGQGENIVTELEMIDWVLNERKPTRWRSETNEKRIKNANHFSVDSPLVSEVHVNVQGVWTRLK